MRRLFAAALATASIVTAGCGGASSSPSSSHPAVTTVNGHACSAADEAIQCTLPPSPFGSSPFRLSAPGTHGVDFAWGAPGVAQMRAYGARFGASYFSYDPSKGWAQRPGLVTSYHAAGIATVGVWETGASRAAEGCAAGRSDAFEAARQAAAVGNVSRPIDFAIDFDASGPQVAAYFGCAHSVLGPRTGAYGGYRPLQYLCAHGLVGRTNWQTYAWSNGAWLPASCAPLEQILNGSSVDYDRAIAADFGQWPGPRLETSAQRHVRERRERAGHEAVLRGLRARILVLRHVEQRYGCTYRRARHEHLTHNCKRWFKAGDTAHLHGRYEDRKIRELKLALSH